ncbi:glycosyltransferase family 4 protein [Vibrio renipiscarius]|uniref:glycosyltransferase family 4 protein n=1 Tax=Vibrio renipiscarius TaxID=1461322 RepID=UPI00069AB9B3|nr:glycosyltransferase family 4 protein [Vibrio renipiscarius]
MSNNHSCRVHNLIFDPIPFKGGSKIATSEALNQCNPDEVQLTILTVDREYWQHSSLVQNHKVNIVTLTSIPWLSQQFCGLLYWVNQCYFTFILLLTLLRLPKVHHVIGASGPGIDMSIYLAKALSDYSVVQLIHGNVACSRSIGWCLTKANNVFYLPSAKPSITAALSHYIKDNTQIDDSENLALHFLNSPAFQPFVNGISSQNWPSKTTARFPVCFWCASLLKWKGLDVFIDSLRKIQFIQPVASTICYIQPKQTTLDMSVAPVNIAHTRWHHDPANLDAIRSQCNIFVSTSHHEPFGLSILEALAAGMCVIIPRDGSYWDQKLRHNIHCIKYQAGDSTSLSQAILSAYQNRKHLQNIQAQGYKISQHYNAAQTYARIVNCVSVQYARSSEQAQNVVNTEGYNE